YCLWAGLYGHCIKFIYAKIRVIRDLIFCSYIQSSAGGASPLMYQSIGSSFCILSDHLNSMNAFSKGIPSFEKGISITIEFPFTVYFNFPTSVQVPFI